MTQISQQNYASEEPRGNDQKIHIVPVGEVISDLTYHSLMAILESLMGSTGIAQVTTSHLSWNIFIHGGSIAFIEDQKEFLPTLLRKLNIKKTETNPNLLRSISKNSITSIEAFSLLGEIFVQDRKNCLTVFKEILFENLLAISLEQNFSLLWNPLASDTKIILPIWKFTDLQTAIAKVTNKWIHFKHVKHPYQRVQLLDNECDLAKVPVFAQVTNGHYRISEIADHFCQHVMRTASKLDQLAEIHTVKIEPLPNRSTNFGNTLSAEANLDKSLKLLAQPRVIIVDDSPVLLKQFGDLLSSWGYQMSLIDDSANATKQILLEKPDIVFLDINMPNLNGFELIKQIRRQPSLASTPLVLITAENSITNNFRAKWANCRFLSKPSTSKEIKDFRDQVRVILQELAPN